MVYSLRLSPNTNFHTNSRVYIVDNFYSDPDYVREYALSLDYYEGPEYIGRRTREQHLFPGLKSTFERIMGQPITKWEDHKMNGRFQWNMAGDPLVYHSDDQRWAGMIYLTPDAPAWSGTRSHKHRASGIHHVRGVSPDIVYNQHTFLDESPYDVCDVFGNVFNRLVIFDGRLIHSAGGYFGYEKSNARLWHMFFFDSQYD